MAITLGDSKSLTAIVLPVGAPQAIVWSTSDPLVIEVAPNGSVVTKGAGIADAIATTPNGVTNSCKVTVKVPVLDSVRFNKSTKSVRIGQQGLSLDVIPTPPGAEYMGGVWASNNTDSVTVDQEGHITVLSEAYPPEVTYTVNGKVATCKITVLVESDGVPVTGVAATGVNTTVQSSHSGIYLTNPVLPEDASDVRFEWTVEDPSGVLDLSRMGPGPYNTRTVMAFNRRVEQAGAHSVVKVLAKPLGKPELGFMPAGQVIVNGVLTV